MSSVPAEIIALAAMPLLALSGGCEGARSAKERVTKYLDTIDRHDVDGALALVAEDFELRFAGSSASISKADLRKALEWEAAVDGHSSHQIVSSTTKAVTVRLTEWNDFFALIGIEELSSLNVFEVNGRGLIESQRTEIPDGQPSWMEAMQPAVEWSRVHHPDELAEIYVEGRISYDGESAQRWLTLLRKWRGATSATSDFAP